VALKLPKHAWRTITWRQGTCDQLQSRFARIRVHASPTRGRRGRPEETLLIEWLRHIPNSIATLHRRLVVAIARMLPRCPCWPAASHGNGAMNCDAVRLICPPPSVLCHPDA